ncbi:MAG: CBS domain-containing protein [Rhodospirillales bacterium]
MLVSEILRKKRGSAITMNPTDGVETAIRMFKEKKIGAILVCGPTGNLVGIVTERDVLHGMAKYGAATLNQKVEEIMSQAHTCKMDDNVRSVMRQMTNKRVRHVPVVDGGELKGMVSIGDIVKNQLDEAQLEIDTMRDFARTH